jgi:hypothetical protein
MYWFQNVFAFKGWVGSTFADRYAKEQLASAWEMLTNRGQSGVGRAAGMGKVDGHCAVEADTTVEKVPPSRRGDGFITFECFVRYGNQAFAACTLA